MSCGTLRDCAVWKEKNPWADQIPFVMFGNEDMTPLGVEFLSPLGAFPLYRVENAPIWDASEWGKPFSDTFAGGAQLFIRFARMIANKLPQGPIWVLHADADGGLLACAMAKERGAVVALSATPPGAMAAQVARMLGVDISHRDISTPEG